MTTTSYKIPADNLPGLVEHIAKLNKKVEKLAKKGYAVEPIKLAIGPAEVKKLSKINPLTGEPYERITFPVTLTGSPVKAEGWEFIATLQHEEGGTIVRSVPGATQEGELAQFRECEPSCEHCGYKRKRNDTFVLRKVE